MLDLQMPEIDGPTLYREVLARWPAAGVARVRAPI